MGHIGSVSDLFSLGQVEAEHTDGSRADACACLPVSVSSGHVKQEIQQLSATADRVKDCCFLPLLKIVERLTSPFFPSVAGLNEMLAPAVVAALSEAEDEDRETLLALLQRFGWHVPKSQFDNHPHGGGDGGGVIASLRELAAELKLACIVRGEEVGRGTYAVAYCGFDRISQEQVVIKRVRMEQDGGVPYTSLREVSVLRELCHDNIVRLRDVIVSSSRSRMYLVMDRLDCDLRQHLARKHAQQPPPPLQVKRYLYQILSGLAYAHSQRVMHRDLKPDNILVDVSSDELRIADFGLARSLAPDPTRAYTQEVVTLLYRPPELLLGTEQYGTPVDVWSAGCCFAELLLRKPLFWADSQIGMLFAIFRVLGTPTEAEWPGVGVLPHYQCAFPRFAAPGGLGQAVPGLDACGLELLSRMLRYDPSSRISAADALRHPYFRELLPRTPPQRARDPRMRPCMPSPSPPPSQAAAARPPLARRLPGFSNRGRGPGGDGMGGAKRARSMRPPGGADKAQAALMVAAAPPAPAAAAAAVSSTGMDATAALASAQAAAASLTASQLLPKAANPWRLQLAQPPPLLRMIPAVPPAAATAAPTAAPCMERQQQQQEQQQQQQYAPWRYPALLQLAAVATAPADATGVGCDRTHKRAKTSAADASTAAVSDAAAAASGLESGEFGGFGLS